MLMLPMAAMATQQNATKCLCKRSNVRFPYPVGDGAKPLKRRCIMTVTSATLPCKQVSEAAKAATI